MKQNLLITPFMIAIFSFFVIPLQAKQMDGFWGHNYKTKTDIPSKFERIKNDRPAYQRNHPQACRHHKKGQRFQRKFHRSAGMNKGPGFNHNTGNKFQNYSQRDGLSQNSNPKRWDGFNRNQLGSRSGDFHGKAFSKQGRKSQMHRHHHDRGRKSRIGHRNWRNDRHGRRD